jgi:Mg2+ and Co2+ transporter CorA
VAASTRPPSAAPTVARLTGTAGGLDSVTPQDLEGRLVGGGFLWLDIENPSMEQLQQFGASLQLDDANMRLLAAARQKRPSFGRIDHVIQALVPSASGSDLAGGAPIVVGLVDTKRFLLTVHVGPCPAMEDTRRSYAGLPEREKADGRRVLFMVLDDLVGGLEPLLLNIDEQLDDIEVALLGNNPPGGQREIINHRKVLSDVVQALSWYAGDLGDYVADLEVVSTDLAGAAAFDRHRQRVVRIKDAANDCRDEAKDALTQYASNVSDRQGRAINTLTIVTAIFLPLTFITGYFGMNFAFLNNPLITPEWAFWGLGVALPALSVIGSIVLVGRLFRRLGLKPLIRHGLEAPPSPDSTGPNGTTS